MTISKTILKVCILYEMDVFYYKRRFWVVYFSDLPTVGKVAFVCLLLFVLTRPGRDAHPIYFLDPLPDCIVSTECYMSIDFHRPRASC
jgi:hypothetical protein